MTLWWARRFWVSMAGAVFGVALTIAIVAPAHAADEEPPDEPTRGGPVLTIPISTDSEEFAMMLVGAVAPQPLVTAGESIAVAAQFAGSGIDNEVCVLLNDAGCLGILVVDPDGSISGMVEIPQSFTPGAYDVSLESPKLGVVVVGETTVEATPATTVVTTTVTTVVTSEPPVDPPAEGVDEPTTVVEGRAEPAAGSPTVGTTSQDEQGLGLLIGAIAVLLIGLIGMRYRRRGKGEGPHKRGDRLANFDLPTATQLPDREAEPAGAVAVRTHRLEPGDGFVLIALRRREEGVVEDDIGRYTELETAMHAARVEASGDDKSDVMWWEVRKHGSSLPVWLIEGRVAPVPSGGSVPADPDEEAES